MFTPEQNPPAPCTDYQDWILDREHGQWSEPVRSAVEAHLAACPACRQFADDLESLDAVLESEFQGKELPASFRVKLLARIATETPAVTPDQVARRKQSIESEFSRESAGLLQRVVRERWSSFLDGLGLGALVLVAALILSQVRLGDFIFGALFARHGAGHAPLAAIWLAAAASVTYGLWVGLRRQPRHYFHY
jgi:anti-sigma factor RsiW